MSVGTNRHFKRRQEEMNALATAALAGVQITRIPWSFPNADVGLWYVYMPDGTTFRAHTKLGGARHALNMLERGFDGNKS